jgi:hypothetical protein
MPPSAARAEQDFNYCESIRFRCSNKGKELRDLLYDFIKTVRDTSRNFFPDSLEERRGILRCLRDIKGLPSSFPDDFTLDYHDACLGASMVEFIGDAMQDLRHDFPIVANDLDVVSSYSELCECLTHTFTLVYNRDGSEREFDPRRNSFHDKNRYVPGPPSRQLEWAYGFSEHEPTDKDRLWGAMVDAEYYIEHLLPEAP